MDHYKVLGLSRNANKDEIKEAFRKLAMQFHPDKHAQSSKSIRDGASHRFKQVSEAYEILMDDRMRADYNIRQNVHRARNEYTTRYGYGHGSYSRPNASNYYSYTKPANGVEAILSRFEITLRYITTRSFLLNVAFVGILFGATAITNVSGGALWKMNNSGVMLTFFLVVSLWLLKALAYLGAQAPWSLGVRNRARR